MKKFFLISWLVVLSALVVVSVGGAARGDALIDPQLKTFAGTLGANGVSTEQVLVLTKPVALSSRPARYDRPNVVNYFHEASRLALLPLMASVQNGALPGVKILNAFWINGSVLAEVTPQGLLKLSKEPSVTKIYKNGRIVYEPGLHISPASRFGSQLEDAPNQMPYHFSSIGLDRLNKEQPNVIGTGVTVGEVDTGVDGTHPALAGKIALFYNGQTKTTGNPVDFQEHGTHTSGTILGGSRSNPQTATIGVAPGAKLVMAAALQGYDQMLQGMQFFLDQRTNPAASSVKVIGCSWNSGGAPDQELFYRAIAAWEASGILPVFSAGNAGTNGITPPHEYPGAYAIGAFGADGKIADFSSVGPGHYNGQTTQKPDISAPGVDILSTIPGGQFAQMSGTSMAQPHVSGTAALLLQVKPDLNPAQLRLILTKSATPVAAPGQWDAHYGFGKLNAYNAVKSVFQFARMGAGYMLNSLSDIMMSPELLDYQEIAGATLGEVGGIVDQYQDTDSTRWLTVSEAFH